MEILENVFTLWFLSRWQNEIFVAHYLDDKKGGTQHCAYVHAGKADAPQSRRFASTSHALTVGGN